MAIGRDYFEIEAELKKRVEGDVHFDKVSRLLYSTDASIYQIEPIGVVVPRYKGDVGGDRDRQSLGRFRLAARRRHFSGWTDCQPLDRVGLFQIHAERLGGEQRRTLVPRAAGLGAR